MVISSLVVETTPDATQQAEKLAESRRRGARDNGYKVVVTIEAETVDASHEWPALHRHRRRDGVNLVYANFEDDPSLQKAAVS